MGWNGVQQFLQKINNKGNGTFRLPSEAEWEYSARARTTTSFGYGEDYAYLGDFAWYKGNSGRATHAVSAKKANNWGIHDMHGNVWEWSEDDYHETYEGAPTDGSAWKDTPRGVMRLLRGGSWNINLQFCRSSFRHWSVPDNRLHPFGFRLSKTQK
jgi:formylglycine-generating enzyme required for sulfatase activity